MNRERLRKLKATYELIHNLKDEVKKGIADALKSNEAKHKELIKNLLIQGMFRMMERTIQVSCRKEHEALVRGVSAQACKEFTSILSVSGKQMESVIELSTYKLSKASESL